VRVSSHEQRTHMKFQIFGSPHNNMDEYNLLSICFRSMHTTTRGECSFASQAYMPMLVLPLVFVDRMNVA
jgi:hypothetical protein